MDERMAWMPPVRRAPPTGCFGRRQQLTLRAVAGNDRAPRPTPLYQDAKQQDKH